MSFKNKVSHYTRNNLSSVCCFNIGTGNRMCFLDTFWIRRNSKETYKKCHVKFTNSVRDDLLTEEYFLEN